MQKQLHPWWLEHAEAAAAAADQGISISSMQRQLHIRWRQQHAKAAAA